MTFNIYEKYTAAKSFYNEPYGHINTLKEKLPKR